MTRSTFTPEQQRAIAEALRLQNKCMNCGFEMNIEDGDYIKVGRLKLIRLCDECMELVD